MPRIGLPHANRRLAVTATDTTTGGDVRLTYGNVTNPATTTSFWQFNVTSTSTFNLNRVNAAGTVLNAINILEDGTTRFTGANGFVEILHGVSGAIGIDIVNSGSVGSYLDFRMAGGDSDYDFRFIQSTPTTLVMLGQSGGLFSVGVSTQFTTSLNLTNPGLSLRSNPVSNSGVFRFSLNSSDRWDVGRNNATETGGASGRGGSDFFIASYDNSGANPTVDLVISRSDSRTTFLASGYRSGSFQSSHNQAALSANRTVIWPDLGGQVVVRSDSTAPANGEILIGNGTQFVRAPLTPGPGISITPGAGTLTIAATGGAGTSITVNKQTLSASLTLTSSSANHQFLDPNDANRNVDLPTGFTGGFFAIKNIALAGNAFNLVLRNPAATTLFTIPAQYTVSAVWDGTEWQVM